MSDVRQIRETWTYEYQIDMDAILDELGWHRVKHDIEEGVEVGMTREEAARHYKLDLLCDMAEDGALRDWALGGYETIRRSFYDIEAEPVDG